MNELRKCPFCGGEAELFEVFPGRFYAVVCPHCVVETTYYETSEKAIEAWNRRADDGKVD